MYKYLESLKKDGKEIVNTFQTDKSFKPMGPEVSEL